MPRPVKTPRVESLERVVLCIDDNDVLLECYKEFLEDFGFKVLVAPCGRRGLELAELSLVDLVLLDYQMPEMDGFQVTAKLRRTCPGTPIILLSGAVDIPAPMLELVDGFVPKADLTRRLLPAIAELIGMPKLPSQAAKAPSERPSIASASI